MTTTSPGAGAAVPAPTVPALAVRGLRKSYPGVRAVDGVSLTVGAGRVHGLVGENGAGKSTLMKMIAGAIEEDEGEILVHQHAGEALVRPVPRLAEDIPAGSIRHRPARRR